ncbi:uncharacterized protein LOC122752259 [Dromiciops gliroides]|uniref:uncharacterized protein LOC122752259 n=1 Tax=Dromiciops gliroides TaxID=33562 RepID=UPI001CC35E2D|nr:uncharacterized protein LOC122752259 [Dromiciops gliroides]
MTECAGPGVLYFSKGTRYSYRYSTSSSTSLQGPGMQKSSLGLQGLVILDVISRCHMVLWLQDIQVKSSLESKEEPVKESESLRMTLEKFPLSFVFRDGKIPKVCPQQGDPSWVVNIKRGILSLLQTSPGTTKPETIDEVDVLGKCPTTYERKGSQLLKTKDLNQCSLRYHGLTFLRSEVLPGMPPILASKLECYQSFQEGLLEDTDCTEFDVVRPYSEKGNGVQTRTHSTLSLLHMRPQALSNKGNFYVQTAEYGKFYVSNLLYEWEGLATWSQVANVAESVRKLCLAQATSFETAELFMELVFELRGLSANALMDLWQRSSFKCRDNWQPLVDALPSCGTEACVALMKELIVSGDVENDEVESFLWSLAFVPQPTAGMVHLLLPLLQSPAAGPSAFLSITALVHNLCMAGGACERLPGVSSLMRILKEALGENCSSQGTKDSGRLQLILKAIGNAGLAAAPVTPILSSCAATKSNAPAIRLAAIQAFRRIPCSVDRSQLAQLYQATEEEVEIRMTAYYFFMKCPSEEAFALVRETQAAEQSTQVGAFVWSHLSQLLETDDPLKRSLRDSLPDDILSQEFEAETWKHSSYSDITFRSASSNMGANLEGTLLFSPASFLPRSIMANLTIHVMGHAVNILELGLRVENAEKLAYRLFGRQSAMAAFWDDEEKSGTKPDTDTELADGVNEKKSGLARIGCSGQRHSKMKELQEKVTQRWGKRKDLQCGLSLKIFGNELSFVDCGAVKSHMKRYSLNLAELTVKLLKGQEVQINRRLSLATEERSFPTLSGLPVQLALNASAAINIRIRGTVDFKQLSDFSLEGYIKPSALIQISAQMGVAGFHGKAGVKWVTGIRSSTSLDGGITVKRGQELKMFLNTPEESMELVNFSSKLYLTTVDGAMNIDQLNSPSEMQSCTGEEESRIWGWKMCSQVSYPSRGQPFSLALPITAAVTLTKQDKGLQQYLLEAAYTYIPQKESWIPEEATIHFFMGTPKSERPRDVGVDLSFSVPQKKLRIKLLHPKKKIKVDGKIDSLHSTRFGHLEMILDEKAVYYIKGLSDVQTSRGEQRYETQLEAKLIRRGSPVILMGNITKQVGRKMTFSVSLMNMLKDKAYLSAVLEKKAEDGLQMYALEAEVYLPDILGFHAIGLLQQRGSLWTNALRIKYGLLGEAKHLQQQCNVGQKLKVENRLEVYKLDLGHEFHCTQVPTYNHKVQLQHEESVSRLYSMLEVSYGKHWDEINNKRKLRVSQTFKNDSGPALSNYFMEFLLQVPERQVDYRTQLQHSSFSQGHVESSTHLKVQYNGRLPFMAGLQWKDTSRGLLWKWEGSLNLDTPWLLLSLAHRLHQPHRAMYQATWELTAGKALSIRNLVVEMSCKNKIRDKEGKIHIHTPTTTYLRASTLITWDQSVLRSQGELVTTWSPLVQIKVHLENRRNKKLFHCWLKGPRQGLNLTSAYRHTEQPRKTTVLITALWSDSKSQPNGLHLEGQLEELRRERMLYQKRGTLQFRHPLKLPMPQSFLLQETFTADKSQKHYMLETKVLVNGLEECVQTLTLGYQADRPYICATLTHPYNSKVIPKSIDTCVLTRIQQNVSGNQEVEAALKVNQKDILHLKGKHHNKSVEGNFRHDLNLDLTHSTQLRIPQALGLHGEIFFRQHPMGEFDCGITVQAAVSQKVTSQFLLQLNGSKSHFGFFSQLRHPSRVTLPPNFQVQAAGRRHKDRSINGSLSVHASGKELVLLEASVHRETRKSSHGWDARALLRQAIFTDPRAVWLQLSGKVTPARVWFFTKMMLNQNSVQLLFTGLKEQKVGPILTLQGRVQHNIDSWGAVPKLLSLTGSLKQKNHSNEGNLSILVDDAMFRLRLRDKHMLGNSSIHSVTCVMIQNGSRAIPEELRLRGQLQIQPGGYLAHATCHADETILSLGATCILALGHRQLSANLVHNSSYLRNAGLSTNGEILFSHTYLAPNHRLTLGLQSNGGHVDAALRMEGPSGEFPETRITANLSHNVEDFRQLGIPFSVEGDCYYQNSGSRLVASVKAGMDGKHLRMALERKKDGGQSEEVVLGLQHSVPGLIGVVPSRLQVSCSGEASSRQLSGHCSGDVSRHPFEVQTSFSALGFRRCGAVRLHYHRDGLSIGGCHRRGHGHEVSGGLVHTFPCLRFLHIPRDMKVRAFLRCQPGGLKARLNLTAEGQGIHTHLDVQNMLGFKKCRVASSVRGKADTLPINHTVETWRFPTPCGQGFEGHVHASLDRRGVLLSARTHWQGWGIAKIKLFQDLSQKPKPQSLGGRWSVTFHSKAKNRKIKGSLEVRRIQDSFHTSGVIWLLDHGARMNWTWEHQWRQLRTVPVPSRLQLVGWVTYGPTLLVSKARVTVGGQPLRVELLTSWGKKTELKVMLHHTILSWLQTGIPERNWFHGAAQLGGRADLSLEVLSGACRVSGVGRRGRRPPGQWELALRGHCPYFQSPAVMSLNASLLTHGCKASLVGHLSSGEAFTHIRFHTFCGLHNHLEAQLQHSWPLLKKLGIARENQIRVSTTGGDAPRALLELTIGPCSVMADGDKAGFPQSLATRGSLRVGPCDGDLNVALQSDGGDAHMHLATSCRQKPLVQGSLHHSFSPLGRLGLPPSSAIHLLADVGPVPKSSLTLQVGQCRLQGRIELQPRNKTQWVLETQTDCELLQVLGIPSQMHLNGSAQVAGCQVKLLCTLRMGDQEAFLELRGACQPQLTIRATFTHTLLVLWAIPEETKLSFQAGKQAKYQLSLELRSEACELQANGDLLLEKKFQWRGLVENSCKVMQDLGAPGRIDGSGYVVLNSMDLDAQMLVTVDDSTLRGLLILKATETHQELDMLFTHNFLDTIHFGIPARTLVDVTTVRSNHSYRRTIRFGMDNKQISEELSFTQQSNYISFDYKIRHNVPTLQALGVEDKIDLQVSLDHQAAKNLTGRAQYGSGIIIFGGQSQSTTARHSWSGSLSHNWPALLQCGLPESLQVVMYFHGTNPNIDSSVNILVGQTSLNYTMSCSYTRQQMVFSCWSRHNSSALKQKTGYPEVASLTLGLQTQETQTQGNVDIQGGDRKVSVDVTVLTALKLNGTFELVTHIQHTVPILRQLGLPLTTQLLFQEILAVNEMKASLEVTCESQTSLLVYVRGRNQALSKELHVTSQQHLSFLLNHFPRRAQLSTKVNYSRNETESMISIDLEKHHFHMATRLTFEVSNLTQVTELMHTIPQLKIIPWEMVLLTTYQKANGTRTIKQLVLWGGQEFKFIGSYTGLFPKFSRSQHMQVELVHPLSIPFPQHSKITMSLLHSVHSHQDDLVIEWNSKEQVVLSSSLKLGKDHVDGQVAFAHPFNLSWSHIEARSLAEKRGSRHSQQVQLAWNRGKPVNFQLTWADRSEATTTSWEGCLTATSGQLQKFLTLGNLKACGSVTQTPAVFREHLDLSWDSQKVKQSLKYERHQPLQSDRLHAEVTLENIFLTACPRQSFLGEIETNYLSRLSHSLSLGLCDLSSAIVISGEHLLSQGSFMLQSRSLLHLAPNPGDGLVLALTFRNHSTPKTQDFSGELELRAPGDQQVSLLGRLTESASQSTVLLQGSMEREEKLELMASRDPDCLRAYLAYGKGTKEEGVEISACSDGKQMAKAEATLRASGGHSEHLGQLILRAANQSVSLAAHGCITPIGNMESKMAEVGSHLQARLVEKFQVFDTYLQKFQDLVQQIDFLDSAAGWVLQMSQAAVRALQVGGRAAAGLWRQSSARQVLRHHLPLQLERLQTVMEQTQSELQKPLATLKDAYYEVTLKPLDEVWQERTEEALRKMKAYVPSGMKDTWLMRPILLSLQAVKGALDLAAHQILKWAEVKFSRAIRRIRKPLSNIYSFSARNCSVVVRLPVLPGGDQPVDLAKVTNYLIEEKLLQPLRELYGINLLAEYYRIKHRLLENPFEHHAVMIGDRHVMTFDGQAYDLTSKCSLLLAKDFAHNSFVFLLNQSNTGPRSLYVEMNHTAFIIYPGLKVYKIYDSSLMGENCLGLDPLPAKLRTNGRKEVPKIELSNDNGAMFSCDIHSDLCSMTLDGWNHGMSAGILGTNDNEVGNDLLLPNGSLAGSLDEFTKAWQVDGKCRTQGKKAGVCLEAASTRLCKAFFLDAHSELRNCFRVVDPAPFYGMCIRDTCEMSELQASCSMVSAYIHLCSRGFVPLTTPPPCV